MKAVLFSILVLAGSFALPSLSLASGCMGYRSSYELGVLLKTEEVRGQFTCANFAGGKSCVFLIEEASPRRFTIYLKPQARLPERVSFAVVIESFEAMEYDDCSYDGRYVPNGTYERFFVGNTEVFRFVD